MYRGWRERKPKPPAGMVQPIIWRDDVAYEALRQGKGGIYYTFASDELKCLAVTSISTPLKWIHVRAHPDADKANAGKLVYGWQVDLKQETKLNHQFSLRHIRASAKDQMAEWNRVMATTGGRDCGTEVAKGAVQLLDGYMVAERRGDLFSCLPVWFRFAGAWKVMSSEAFAAYEEEYFAWESERPTEESVREARTKPDWKTSRLFLGRKKGEEDAAELSLEELEEEEFENNDAPSGEYSDAIRWRSRRCAPR